MEPIAVLTQSQLRDLVTEAARQGAELALSGQKSKPDELWDSKQVADYLDCTPYHVTQELAYKPGFPKAYIASGTTKIRKRWKAADIINWQEGRRV